MNDLINKKCVPCEGGVPALDISQIHKYQKKVDGWDVKSNKTLIRFGKELSEKRLNNFNDTVNYLFEISRIPSIIDVRYKDGVALKYGK